MVQLSDVIDTKCRCMREIVQLVEWYFMEQYNDIDQVAVSGQDEYYSTIVGYNVYLDAINNTLNILIGDMASHFDFEDKDMQELLERMRAHI